MYKVIIEGQTIGEFDTLQEALTESKYYKNSSGFQASGVILNPDGEIEVHLGDAEIGRA